MKLVTPFVMLVAGFSMAGCSTLGDIQDDRMEKDSANWALERLQPVVERIAPGTA